MARKAKTQDTPAVTNVNPKRELITDVRSNGIRRPKVGTVTSKMWKVMDDMLEKAGGIAPAHADIKKRCDRLKHNGEPLSANTVASQICLWRRYYDLPKTREAKQFGGTYKVPTTKAEIKAVEKAKRLVIEEMESRSIKGGLEPTKKAKPAKKAAKKVANKKAAAKPKAKAKAAAKPKAKPKAKAKPAKKVAKKKPAAKKPTPKANKAAPKKGKTAAEINAGIEAMSNSADADWPE